MIRPYRAPADVPGVLACIEELQDFERGMEPTLRPGAEMSHAYLAYITQRCGETGGRILVAESESDGGIVGFVSVWTHVQPDGPDEPPEAYAYVSDLVVLPAARGRGVGRALLAAGEDFARGEGAGRLRIGVLAQNVAARALYADMGFVERRIELAKEITPG